MTATARRDNLAVTGRGDRAISASEEFEAIYDAFHARIFGLAYRMMGNADDARDVTQDAFISAYQNLHKVVPSNTTNAADRAHISAWLYRIAANKCIDALRKRNRRAGVDWDDFARTAPASSRDGGQPEVHALDRERAEQIQRVLDAMSPQYRLVLLLHEYQGQSIREISQQIDRSEAAVKSMLFRAREQFRSLYGLDQALEQAA